eukprot:6481703-Prymnesium_polylepis.1
MPTRPSVTFDVATRFDICDASSASRIGSPSSWLARCHSSRQRPSSPRSTAHESASVSDGRGKPEMRSSRPGTYGFRKGSKTCWNVSRSVGLPAARIAVADARPECSTPSPRKSVWSIWYKDTKSMVL